jgi:hypothetical protein
VNSTLKDELETKGIDDLALNLGAGSDKFTADDGVFSWMRRNRNE